MMRQLSVAETRAAILEWNEYLAWQTNLEVARNLYGPKVHSVTTVLGNFNESYVEGLIAQDIDLNTLAYDFNTTWWQQARRETFARHSEPALLYISETIRPRVDSFDVLYPPHLSYPTLYVYDEDDEDDDDMMFCYGHGAAVYIEEFDISAGLCNGCATQVDADEEVQSWEGENDA